MYPTLLHPPGPNSCTQTLGIWMVCAMAQFLGEQAIPGTASFSLCYLATLSKPAVIRAHSHLHLLCQVMSHAN